MMMIAVSVVVVLLLGFWTWRRPRQASVIVWALVATLFVCAALLKILPGSFGDNVLWYAAISPVIWAFVQVWTYWEKKIWRVPAVLIAASAVSGIVIITVPSPV